MWFVGPHRSLGIPPRVKSPEHRHRATASFVFLALILLASNASAQTASATFDDIVANATEARSHNDIPGAVALYAQAVQLKPDWPEGWWYLGMLQYGSGAYSAARDALTHFIALTPNSGPAFAVRGLCEFETGEYPQSAQDIQQGLALGAGNDPQHENLLRYHQLLLFTVNGDFEGALREYAVFARNAPPSPEILIGIGLAGLRIAARPQDIDPKQQDLVMAAGSAGFQFMAGNKAKAQQEFQSLFQRFPAAANAHYFYGYLLFADDPDLAIAEFKRELEVAPSNAVTHVMLAWYFILRSDASEALPYAQKAAAEAPDSPSAQLVLGRSLVETGNVDQGMTHLQAGLKLDPSNLEIHLALVKGYSESGRKDDATRERLLCIELTKGMASAPASP
jgi:tetratricopeptide (TPR) repeat protein